MPLTQSEIAHLKKKYEADELWLGEPQWECDGKL